MKTDLVEIFQTMRAILQPYENMGFNVRVNSENTFDVWSEKNIVIDGRKRNEIHFCTIKINKGYVGFYFMPYYADEDIRAGFHPELLKLLKGKSCFHVKKLDNALLGQLESALKVGYTLYKKNEWV